MQGTLTIGDPEFPDRLRASPALPKRIYYRGSYNPRIFDLCLGVIGSRKISDYGRRVTRHLIPPIARLGVTVVSGFMNGVDACAHQETIAAQGKTIAVLPCGIDRVHPSTQRWLHEEIIDSGGLILSEYPGLTTTAPWTFPRRNKIVAALSDAVLVIEASCASGSLMTAGFALEYGKPVLAVPNSIFAENSDGIVELLKNGAIAICSVDDVMNVLTRSAQILFPGLKPLHGGDADSDFRKARVETVRPEAILSTVSRGAHALAYLLKQEPQTVDAASQRLSWTTSHVCRVLTELQTASLIYEREGVFYAY